MLASFKWDVGSSVSAAPRAALDENDARVNTSTSSSATKSYSYRVRDYNIDNAAENEGAACPQSVALATAFKKRSLDRWEEAKKLRADPILPELERMALETAKQKQTKSSAIAAAAFTSTGSGVSPSPAVDVFRQRSKQSWQKQREELRSQAAEIEHESAKSDRNTFTADRDSNASSSSSSSSRESLAVQLHRRGYGLDSTSSSQKTEAKMFQGGNAVASSSFRDASRDAWQATKALRSELPSDVFAGTGAL